MLGHGRTFGCNRKAYLHLAVLLLLIRDLQRKVRLAHTGRCPDLFLNLAALHSDTTWYSLNAM